MYVGYIAVSRLRFFLWPPLGDHSPHFPSTIGSSGFRTTGNCSERLVHFPSHPPERSPKEKTQKNPPIVFDHYKKMPSRFLDRKLGISGGKRLGKSQALLRYDEVQTICPAIGPLHSANGLVKSWWVNYD